MLCIIKYTVLLNITTCLIEINCLLIHTKKCMKSVKNFAKLIQFKFKLKYIVVSETVFILYFRSWSRSCFVMPINWRSSALMEFCLQHLLSHICTQFPITSSVKNWHGLTLNSHFPSSQVHAKTCIKQTLTMT